MMRVAIDASESFVRATPEVLYQDIEPTRKRKCHSDRSSETRGEKRPGGQLVSTVVDTFSETVFPGKARTLSAQATLGPLAWTLTDNRR